MNLTCYLNLNPTENFDYGRESLPPLLSEQLLIDRPVPDFNRALVVSLGRAQLAAHLVESSASAEVDAWFIDRFAANSATPSLNATDGGSRIQVVCSADLPEGNYQLVAMSVISRGEAELTRDLLQQAHQRLEIGGHLMVSVDNPQDNWLLEQMHLLFPSVNCFRSKAGAVYTGKKQKSLKRVRDFSCQFAFKDQGRMLQAISEPGVFSHRRLDPGARQLMNICDIDDGDRVLDMGSGCGAVAFAAACQTGGEVWGVDSNARAIRCLEKGAAINDLTNIRSLLNADGVFPSELEFDLVLANPPYYGNHGIAKHFIDASLKYLVSGGALIFVTKKPDWFQEYFSLKGLEDVLPLPSGEYHIVCGRQP